MRKAIITGPTGSIGTALIEQLTANGVKVLAVVRPGSARAGNIPNHPLVSRVELDLNELDALPRLLRGETYDVFYHFGWDGTFGNVRNDMQVQLRNIQYTLKAVDAAAAVGCTRFIGAGSQAEYGRVEGKLSASTPAFPENGYGIAKLAAGQMSRILCGQKGMEHIWTRILSVYGPHDGLNTLVMYTIGKLLNKERPSFTPCGQQWDYLYAGDAGKAMYLIGMYGKNGKVYPIGSGCVRELREYTEIIRSAIDPTAVMGYGDNPYNDRQVMYLCADITELKEDTGFEPSYSFSAGIRETIDWYRSNVIRKKEQ